MFKLGLLVWLSLYNGHQWPPMATGKVSRSETTCADCWSILNGVILGFVMDVVSGKNLHCVGRGDSGHAVSGISHRLWHMPFRRKVFPHKQLSYSWTSSSVRDGLGLSNISVSGD